MAHSRTGQTAQAKEPEALRRDGDVLKRSAEITPVQKSGRPLEDVTEQVIVPRGKAQLARGAQLKAALLAPLSHVG